MNTQTAVQTIISVEVSPMFTINDVSKRNKAYDYIITLSKRSQKRCWSRIQKAINDSHTKENPWIKQVVSI